MASTSRGAKSLPSSATDTSDGQKSGLDKRSASACPTDTDRPLWLRDIAVRCWCPAIVGSSSAATPWSVMKQPVRSSIPRNGALATRLQSTLRSSPRTGRCATDACARCFCDARLRRRCLTTASSVGPFTSAAASANSFCSSFAASLAAPMIALHSLSALVVIYTATSVGSGAPTQHSAPCCDDAFSTAVKSLSPVAVANGRAACNPCLTCASVVESPALCMRSRSAAAEAARPR
mmetsp:Transcript_22149/g.68763  ORF Transcript_22149/g.68763 Transcript_22149/m.68763 type:complete len:235 (+) Transcript_22149:1208-1912(+)